jgi:RND family efflux transporter MFP subunit
MNQVDLNLQKAVAEKVDVSAFASDGGGEHDAPRDPDALLLRRIVVIGAPVLVLVGSILGAFLLVKTGPKAEKNKEPPRPVAVQVTPAQARTMTIAVTAQGEARPRVQSALAAQVAGRIVWISPSYVEGGAFRAGETLVRIDSADYRLAVTRAQAQVAQAQEALQREEAEGELARQDWAELGQGEPSPLVLREPQLAQARAALAAARAQLRSAELDLARTNISAPFAGRVRQRRANVGDYVAPGTPVADVFSTEVMEVRVPLTDADLASLNAQLGFAGGANAPVAHLSAPVAGQQRTWEGRLTRVDAAVDPQTRLTYGVIEVGEPFSARHASPLAPGIFVTARIDSARAENLVAAPRSALKRNEFVYVVNRDNTIDERRVRAAQTTATEVMFRTGLRAGERVVVSPLPSAREGMEVTPMARSGQRTQQAAQQQKSGARP